MIDAVKFGCGFALGQAAFPMMLVGLIAVLVGLWTVGYAVADLIGRIRRRRAK